MSKIEILQKIENLFYTKTFKEISMQNIASEIGMKKASLYYHFSSKDSLIEEVINYSFESYFLFISNIGNIDKKKFIEDFIIYPENNKNLFSIINQNGYCDNENITKIIEEKQKKVFEKTHEILLKKYLFSREKTFLFLSIMQDIWRKKCLYGGCDIDKEKVILEIEKMFF